MKVGLGIASIFVSGIGCSTGERNCRCADILRGEIALIVEDGRLASVTTSGSACAEATFSCGPGGGKGEYSDVPPPSTCSRIVVAPAEPGECIIDVLMADGTERTIALQIVSSCCGYSVVEEFEDTYVI